MDEDDIQPPEPVRGLPETPPEGERLLWQGSPDWFRLATESMGLKWVAIYFALLALWRGLAAWLNFDVEHGIGAATMLVAMGAVACALIMAVAWVQARATVYTVTNRRVVMRIGAALTVTLNLPYRWIGSADLKLNGDGSGTICLDLLGSTRFSYLVIWPHVRPWHMRKAQPALRCIRDARTVADLIAQNARATVTTGIEAAPERAPTPASIAAE
ncbi:MAG: photosynthetic complex putative assembly protein PuhB [Pseudomonadota bacterium]